MQGLGAGCGLVKGDRGLPNPFERPFARELVGEAGECAPSMWGAISLVIGANTNLGASLGDVCMWAGLAVGESTHWGSLTHPFVVGSDTGVGLGDRDGGVSFPLGSARSPPLTSMFSLCSSPLISPPSVWLWLVGSPVRCLCLVSRASRQIWTAANVPRM